MPFKRGCMIVFVLLMLVLPGQAVLAQNDGFQPYILRFEVQTDNPMNLPLVETGNFVATASWDVRAINLNQHVVQLEVFRVNQWELLETNLTATGDLTFNVVHPANFGPPTYRLSIIDPLSSDVLDERTATIPYPPQSGLPIIAEFVPDASNLTMETIADGSQRLPVRWVVENRLPYTNLQFQQVMPDGDGWMIELPRTNAWVPSEGSGELAPYPIEGVDYIIVRLQVIDVADGTVLALQDLIVTLGEAAAQNPQVVDFSATPSAVDREGTISVAWSVTGAEVVQVGQIAPDGRYLRQGDTVPTGSTAFTALPNAYYVQSFFIYAGDALGNGVTEVIAVDIRCPHTFFFDKPVTVEECPLNEVETFPAAYQLFDRGEMLWRSDRGQIMVIFNDGTYEVFDDTYQEGEEINYPDAALEAELEMENRLPIRGFGKVWAQNAGVADGLGFAIGDEVGYDMQGQAVAYGQFARGYGVDYFTFPDGSIVELALDGTWSKVGE